MTATPLRILSAAIVAAAVLAVLQAGFALEPWGFVKLGVAAGSMALLARFYTVRRPDRRLATTLEGTALLLVLTAACAVLSYASLATGRPLVDETYAALDRAIGFDWEAFLLFTAERPLFARILAVAYASSLAQIVTVVLLLGLGGRDVVLQRFLVAYAVSAIVVVVVSGVAPAVGPYVHYGAPPLLGAIDPEAGVWHLVHFEALRAGTFAVFDLAQTEGLVTFPSFHTALAVLCVWAVWGFARLRWPVLVLNVLVVIGTVPFGGHYVVDLIAGGAAALAAIVIADRVVRGASGAVAPTALSTPVRG